MTTAETWRVVLAGGEVREVEVRHTPGSYGGEWRADSDGEAAGGSSARKAVLTLAAGDGWPVVELVVPGAQTSEERLAQVTADRDYWREQATGMAPSVDGMRALGTRLVPGGTGCVVDPVRVVAEVERLRERVAEAEAEAIRWGDALVAIGEAAGLTGAGSAEIVAAVTALVTERNRAKSDLADNDLILEERERQLNVAVTAYHTLVDAVIAYLSAADEYAYGYGEDTHTLDGCRRVLDAVIGSVK